MALAEAHAIDNPERIAALVSQWERLRAPGISTVFGSPAWALAAWQHLPTLGTPLLLAAFTSGGALAGVLPLAIAPRQDQDRGRLLRYAGSPLTDKCDVLLAVEHRDLAIEGLLHAVRSVLGAEDVLELSELDREGLLAGALARGDLPSRFGLAAHWRDGDASPVVPIDTDSVADPRWPSAHRRQWDNRRRWLARNGALRLVRETSAERLETQVRVFTRCRLDRWNRRGRLHELPEVQHQASFEEFLAQCCVWLADQGRCYLAHLLLDDSTVATDLYFRADTVELLYMRTYDPRWRQACPGHLLFLESAAAAAREGTTAIELGRGDEPYKYWLGAVDATLADVQVTVA